MDISQVLALVRLQEGYFSLIAGFGHMLVMFVCLKASGGLGVLNWFCVFSGLRPWNAVYGFWFMPVLTLLMVMSFC